MSRLEILQNSLIKKEAKLAALLDAHFESSKATNGQPMNDKRNGASFFKKMESQNNAIRKANAEIDKTKAAIQREQSKINNVNYENLTTPKPFLDAMVRGEITQWRKYPNRFFVVGIEKARIVWERGASPEKSKCFYSHTSELNDDQRKKLSTVGKNLYAELKKSGDLV
jgi:hypothetical protein